jgi:hypothetical protein
LSAASKLLLSPSHCLSLLLLLVQIRMPDNLYEMVVEVQEQVILPLSTEPSPRNGPTPHMNAE